MHAAATLSIFCFNSTHSMSSIQESIGGLTKESFDDLINSKNLSSKYDTAFYQIVLARIVDGRDPALLGNDFKR